MDWQKILEDAAQFPDTLEMTINGQAVKLGDLRAHNKRSQGDTLTKLQALEARESQIATRETNATAATERLANIVETISRETGLSFDQIVRGDTAAAVAAAAAIRAKAGAEGITATDGKIDWAKDPIYAPVDERFRPVETAMGQVQNALRASLGVYANDRPRLAYIQFRLDNPEVAKGIKFDDAVKLAVERGYKDEVGFVDVSRAMQDLVQPTLNKTHEDKIRADAMEEGRKAALAEMAGSVGRPVGGGAAGLEFEPAQAAGNNGGRVPTIAEQMTKAFSDPNMFAAGLPN